MIRRVPTVGDLRAAWWTVCALRRVRAELASGRCTTDACPPPPRLPDRAVRAVNRVMGRQRATCLEAALIRQRWLAARGQRLDVVIGVTAPAAGFAAHAWLTAPGDDRDVLRGWRELTRVCL